MKALCNFSVGTETEGLEISDAMVSQVWGPVTHADVVNGLREAIKIALAQSLVASGQDVSTAVTNVLTETTDIH